MSRVRDINPLVKQRGTKQRQVPLTNDAGDIDFFNQIRISEDLKTFQVHAFRRPFRIHPGETRVSSTDFNFYPGLTATDSPRPLNDWPDRLERAVTIPLIDSTSSHRIEYHGRLSRPTGTMKFLDFGIPSITRPYHRGTRLYPISVERSSFSARSPISFDWRT